MTIPMTACGWPPRRSRGGSRLPGNICTLTTPIFCKGGSRQEESCRRYDYKMYYNALIGRSVWCATPHKHWRFERSSQIRLPHASAKPFLYAVLPTEADSISESDSN